MDTMMPSIDILSIALYIVLALIIIVPTIRRIYQNPYMSSNQKYMYTALTILLPPIGLLVYYTKSQKERKERYTSE